MSEIDDMIKLNPDNLIYYNRTINGMPIARYIAASILSDSKYEKEEYYKLEDILTKKIQYAFIIVWMNQTKVKPLAEGIPPKSDKRRN